MASWHDAYNTLITITTDGVAPRAKMNQQRSRRFLAAKHRLEEEKRLKELDEEKEENEEGQQQQRKTIFDSNSITPGTQFMDRVAKALRAYVADKIANDPGWHKVKTFFIHHHCFIFNPLKCGCCVLFLTMFPFLWTGDGSGVRCKWTRRRWTQDHEVSALHESSTRLQSQHPTLYIWTGKQALSKS